MENYLIRQVMVPDEDDKGFVKRDILAEQGTVTAIGEHLEVRGAIEVLDGAGRYLSSGWADAHAHLYSAPGYIGMDREQMLHDGVTYVVDAGTAGPGNFEDYLEKNAAGGKMPGKAYVNLAFMGISKEYGELLDLSTVDVNACERLLQKYPDEILGWKLRIDPRVCENPRRAMETVRELSDRTGRPFVVHASRCESMSMEELLSFMRSGDIVAHSFADKAPGLLDDQGKVKTSVREARERGVRFDLSHGKSNFSYAVAQKAIAQGFFPDAISTDLHASSRENVKSLAWTMSKMLACGLGLEKVVKLVTSDAVRMLRLPDKQTRITVGSPVDMTLFEVQEGNFRMFDSDGVEFSGTRKIVPCCTLLGRQVYRSIRACDEFSPTEL